MQVCNWPLVIWNLLIMLFSPPMINLNRFVKALAVISRVLPTVVGAGKPALHSWFPDHHWRNFLFFRPLPIFQLFDLKLPISFHIFSTTCKMLYLPVKCCIQSRKFRVLLSSESHHYMYHSANNTHWFRNGFQFADHSFTLGITWYQFYHVHVAYPIP